MTSISIAEARRRLTLHIDGVLFKKEEGHFVAHALQLGLSVTAPSETRAVEELVNVCATQVISAFQNNNFGDLCRPAPPEIWRKWGEAEVGITVLKGVEIPSEISGKNEDRLRILSFTYVKPD